MILGKRRNRITREEMFVDILKIIEERSTCHRAHVGALLTLESRILSIGYNGQPPGAKHCTVCQGAGCNISIHAEANAISFAAKYGIPTKGTTLYCSLAPCIDCSRLIVTAGVERVYYLKEYRKTNGVDFLRRSGVNVSML